MSYAIRVYAIKMSDLQEVCGGGDLVFANKLIDSFRDHIENSKQDMDYYIDRGAITTDVALREMVVGQRTCDKYGFPYIEAFELLCKYFGNAIETEWFNETGSDYLDAVNSGLDQVGLGEVVNMKKLVFRGAPVEMPEESCGVPSVGYWAESEIYQAMLIGVSYEQLENLEPEVAPGISEILEWIEFANEKQQAIVGFYG